MPLDPQAQLILQQLAAAEGPKLHEVSPEQARTLFEQMQAALPVEDVVCIEEHSAPGPQLTILDKYQQAVAQSAHALRTAFE